MSGTREKLIELIASKVCDTYSEACEEWLPHDCGKCYANNCHIAEIADHLIANGVVVSKMETATIATDNPVGDKLTPTADNVSAVQQWISVKDRLPEYHKKVLTRSKMGTSGHSFYVCELCMFDNELGWMFNDGFEAQDLIEITHWMPLPSVEGLK